MKLGVTYNLFDGEELLPFVSKTVRGVADYIVVLYQRQSYFASKASPNIEKFLFEVKESGLIDDYVLFSPNFRAKDKNSSGGPVSQERIKRNLGLKKCVENKCTHFMSLDVDEAFDSVSIKKIINTPRYANADVLFTPFINYWISHKYQIKSPKGYQGYIPAIYKIRPGMRFQGGFKMKAMADPSRRIKCQKQVVLGVNQLAMHHLSFVRRNLRKKLENITSQKRHRKDKNNILKSFNNWQPFKPAKTKLGTEKIVKGNFPMEIPTIRNSNNVELIDWDKWKNIV